MSVSLRLGYMYMQALSNIWIGNGSDVFGSDICTCRPYLTFGIEEAVKEAQKGGSGVVIYFRKEGRALGEVSTHGQIQMEREILTATGHKVPCLQRKKTWRRSRKRVFQAHGKHRWCQGHAFRK
jgi:hypothetical protein